MTTLVLEREPVAVDVAIREEKLIVTLDDGRSISVPLEWYPRLLHASPRSGRIGTCWEMGMPLSGLILTNISELKGCWRGDAAARAENHLRVGLRLGGDPLNTKSHRFS
jgi:hypothetical protein